MKGIIRHYWKDPETPNSVEGWSLLPIREKFSSISYRLTEDSLKKIDNLDKETELEVEYELLTNCYVTGDGEHVHHGVLANIISL
jgi:hypothetical protein